MARMFRFLRQWNRPRSEDKQRYDNQMNDERKYSTVVQTAAISAIQQEDQGWSKVIEQSSRAIVQIRLLLVRSYEGCPTGSGVATGFVVDKRLGLVLTNRHVVTPAPAICEIVFKNDEEVEAHQFYVDPVHDFGFFRFDPKDVEFMELEELVLNPQGARKGVEVRVVGSDAGEKLMVLKGTISRVDRNPPEYDSLAEDYNTNYIAAACDTSGGSSGSPVLNAQGEVVGLNSGGDLVAATSFFLPLDAVVRALGHIRDYYQNKEEPFNLDFPPSVIPRGVVHCVFHSVSIAECKRLGVTEEEERPLREAIPSLTSLLVVRSVIPGTEAWTKGLKVGDVLVQVNQRYINQFHDLEMILDASIGSRVEFALKRGQSKTLGVDLEVQDAWKYVPNEFIEFSAGIVSPISLSRARHGGLAFDDGVFVDWHGYTLGKANIMAGSVITKVEDEEIKSLEDLSRALIRFSASSSVSVIHFHINSKHRQRNSLVSMDSSWFPVLRARRDLKRYSKWTYTEGETQLGDLHKLGATLQRSISFKSIPKLALPLPNHQPGDNVVDRFESSTRALCHVYFQTPFYINSTVVNQGNGAGFIVDKKLGLVVTSRATVVSLLGDVSVSIASFRRPATVLFLHPVQNFCILQFDPTGFEHLGELSRDVQEGPVRFGETLSLLGLTKQSRLLVQRNLYTVVGKEHVSIPTPPTPRFTAKNFEFLTFQKYITDRCIGGAMLDEATGYTRAFVMQTYIETSANDSSGGGSGVENEGSNPSAGDVVGLFSFPASHVFDCVDIVRKALLNGHSAAASRVEDLEVTENKIQSSADSSDTTSSNPMQKIFTLGCEIGTCPFSEAQRGFNLPLSWCDVIAEARERVCGEEESKQRREVFQVKTVMAGSSSSKTLRNGDLLLAVEGVPLVSIVEQAEKHADQMGRIGQEVTMTILRDKQVFDIKVQPVPFDIAGTRRLITFCGIQMQQTHDAALFHGYAPPAVLRGKNDRGVYISSIRSGSPAEKGGLNPVQWITHVDDVEVNNLDEVKAIVQAFKHKDFVRIRTANWQGLAGINSVQVNLDHWPTTELEYNHVAKSWDLKEIQLE